MTPFQKNPIFQRNVLKAMVEAKIISKKELKERVGDTDEEYSLFVLFSLGLISKGEMRKKFGLDQ